MTTTVLHEFATVGDVLNTAAQQRGDRVAVQDAIGALTFAELRDHAHRLADSLLSQGLLPGDRVLEALPNSCDLLVTEMALALAGLVRVPLNPRLGPREWAGMAADCGARALIVDSEMRGADGASITEHVACEITVRADKTVRADEGALAALIAAGRPEARLPRADADDVIGLAYSSGTTGMPKGALRTHRMRLASMRAMLRDVVEPTGTVTAYLHAGPAIHTSGLFILPMLTLGARQVMAHHVNPAGIAELVQSEHISHLALVPSVIDALAHLPEEKRRGFAHVRMLAYAGAPMPPTQVHRAAQNLTERLVQYYGLVEAIPPVTVLSIDDHARGLGEQPRLLTSAGRIVSEAHVEVRGDSGESAATQTTLGEVVVSGPMVTPGYWNAATRTDLGKSFDGEALFTGDIGVVDDGYLYLADRKNNMLISGGYNVYPGEIESAVATTSGLREVVVVGLDDERWGQRIVLAYTTSSGVDLDATQQATLQHHLNNLAKHKRPKSCHFRTEFPLGATGKIDRRAVTAQLSRESHERPSSI